MTMLFLLIFVVATMTRASRDSLHTVRATQNGTRNLFGNSCSPSLNDFAGISTLGGWFETTLGGLSLFEPASVMSCLTPIANGSLIDVKLHNQPVVHVIPRLWNSDSPNTTWLTAIWDATFHGQVIGVDYTPLAHNLFVEIVGGSSTLAECSDTGKLNLQRTYGARFNTPSGPETRVFSLRDMKMVYPTYPGVGVKSLSQIDSGSIILDADARCLTVWQGAG